MAEHSNVRRVLFAAFIIPVIFILIMYAFTGVFPFGPKTVVAGDMLNQYIAITSFMKRALFHPTMLFYTIQSGIGINAWAVFAYYGTSPLTWVSLFFPTAYLPIYFELNILLSTGFISLTTCWLLIKSQWLNNSSTSTLRSKYSALLTFSSLFALSEYITSYATCTMWTNAIILFPIVLLGWERVLTQQHTWLYLISLTGLIFVNYYIGVIVLEYLFLISFCWVLYKLIHHQFNILYIKRTFKLVILTLLAILNNFIILLPSFIAQKQVNQVKYKFSFQKMMSFSQLGTNFIPFHEKGTAVPLMYGGLLVTLLAVAFFFTQVEWQEKLIVAILVTMLLMSTIIQALYMAWHSFSMPNGFPQREGFVIIFTLMILAYRAWILLLVKPSWQVILVSTGILVIFGVVLSIKIIGISKLSIAFSLTSIVVAGTLAYLVMYRPRLSWILLVFALIDMGISDWPNYQWSRGESLSWSKFARYIQHTGTTIKHLPADSDHYRIGSNAQFNMNDPLLFGYASVSGYLSQLPTTETDYISQLGYYQKHSWYRWADYNNGSTLAVNRLMGFKYYLVLRDNDLLSPNGSNEFLVNNIPAKYIPHNKQIRMNKYTVATDLKAAAIVIPAQDEIFNDQKVKYDPNGNPFDYFNQLIAEVTGNRRVYRSMPAKLIKQENITKKYQLSSDGRMLYLYLPSRADQILNGIKVEVNGRVVARAYGEKGEAENGVICLGQYPRNQQLMISLVGHGVTDISHAIFTSEKAPNLSSTNHIRHLKINANKLYCETDNNDNHTSVLITLAYNQGWHAKVDGKKVAIHPAAGGLMGIKLPNKGYHKIQMTFYPPKLNLGLLVTIISLLITTLSIIISNVKIHRKELS